MQIFFKLYMHWIETHYIPNTGLAKKIFVSEVFILNFEDSISSFACQPSKCRWILYRINPNLFKFWYYSSPIWPQKKQLHHVSVDKDRVRLLPAQRQVSPASLGGSTSQLLTSQSLRDYPRHQIDIRHHLMHRLIMNLHEITHIHGPIYFVLLFIAFFNALSVCVFSYHKKIHFHLHINYNTCSKMLLCYTLKKEYTLYTNDEK